MRRFKCNVFFNCQPLEMPLDRPKRQTGFFGNGFLPSADNTGFAIGIGQKIKIRPKACAHRLTVFTARVGCQALPDRSPPTVTGFLKRQLFLSEWNFADDLIESLHI